MNILEQIKAKITEAEASKTKLLRAANDATLRADEVMNALATLRTLRDMIVEGEKREHTPSGKPYVSPGFDICAVCGEQFHVASAAKCKGEKL